MAESSFLDGGSRLDDVDLDPLIASADRDLLPLRMRRIS
jgi:hypothetical protein